MNTPADDLLWGARSIGEFLGLDEMQILHRLRARAVPTFKIGRTICASRSDLTAWLARCRAEAQARARHRPSAPPR
jgi:hypothetical protein